MDGKRNIWYNKQKPSSASGGLGTCTVRASRTLEGFIMPTIAEKFAAKVNKTSENGCWFWVGRIKWNGYGAFFAEHHLRRILTRKGDGWTERTL